MKNLLLKCCIIGALSISLGISTCQAQIFGIGSAKNFERGLYGENVKNKKTKAIKEPRKVIKAKKQQAKNDAKLKKDYAKYIKASRKRSIKIQTPEVQERMKQNNKETITNNKERRKAVKAASKEAGRKYN